MSGLRAFIKPQRIWHASFFDVNVSQDSVATRLRYGGLLSYQFIANLLLSVPVKK